MNHQEHVVPLLGLSCASMLDACATKRPDPFAFNESHHNQLALPPEMRHGRTQRSRRTIAHTRTNKGHDPIKKGQVKLGLSSVYRRQKNIWAEKKERRRKFTSLYILHQTKHWPINDHGRLRYHLPPRGALRHAMHHSEERIETMRSALLSLELEYYLRLHDQTGKSSLHVLEKRWRRASVAVARFSGSSVNSISRRSSTSVLSTGVVMFWKAVQ